jgi:hypothetical protein
MNCDEVFAILTRGPFPTGGRDDEAVEMHLRFCAECRRIAEALRPSDKLLRESVGIDEGHSLPGYWGDPSILPNQSGISISGQTRLARVQRVSGAMRTRNSVANLNGWQFATAVAVGIVFASAVRSLIPAQNPPPRSLDAIAIDSASRAIRNTAHPDRDAPALAGLKAVCRFGYPPQPTDSIGAEDVPTSGWFDSNRPDTAICCTQCHHAGSDVLAGAGSAVRAEARIRIQNSCTACHE